MSRKIRVALVGVGNCASSLVQGLAYYQNVGDSEQVPGIMHAVFGGYRIRDIEVVAAFDVDSDKVGKDISEAIFSGQNNTYKFTDVPQTGVVVQAGVVWDGIGKYLSQTVKLADRQTDLDLVRRTLVERSVDVVVNYLPVGSEIATQWYAQQAINAGCGFVNCIPVFIAGRPEWARKFEERGLPIIGDDIKSQVGATILHRTLARLFQDRGVRIDRTYQLNFGGNTDFMNMLERERLESKKISKTNAVTSQIEYDLPAADVHVGPSDYVPWLKDRKWCHIRVEGTTFGDVPLNVELKLEVWDSPNSAGVVIDAVRAAKVALDRGEGGPIALASSWFMKSPPQQMRDDYVRDALEDWIAG